MTRAAAEQDVGGVRECHQRSNTYGQEHPSIQERQGEAPQSGKVQHQGLHKAFCLSSGSATLRRQRGVVALPSISLGTMSRRTGAAGATRTRGGGTLADDTQTKINSTPIA